jgi:hypothetical protein
MNRSLTLMALFALWTSAVPGAVAQTPFSEFTTTDPSKVKILEDSSGDKNAEIDYFRHLCPGLGGYQVIHEGGDLRSWINLASTGKVTDLSPTRFPHVPATSHVKPITSSSGAVTAEAIALSPMPSSTG